MTELRRALTRQYRDTSRPMGVYRVRNLVASRSLVGRSVDLPSVLNRERAQLRFGAHPVAELQRDWAAIGAEGFAFEVLDTLAPPEGQPRWDPAAELAELEALWVERLRDEGEALYRSPKSQWPK